jgi:succinate dehydrogenase hydrophobic anchor subunit
LPFLRLCEWLLSLPVFFHALNGGRLILYECFRFRDDEGLIRWMIGLVILFSGLLAILMILSNQDVSALFFWMMTLALAMILIVGSGMRIWRTENTLTWKCQRLSSIFLLVMIPAHFFFMHLNAAAAKESSLVILRMGHPFIKIIDASLVIAVFYHAGFGLISLTKDYTSQKSLHKMATLLVFIMMGFSSLMGIRLILAI